MAPAAVKAKIICEANQSCFSLLQYYDQDSNAIAASEIPRKSIFFASAISRLIDFDKRNRSKHKITPAGH
ncbi:MAG: hypothetical protein CM1200mP4_5500 [Rhodospirillaceae bacterium]|nr:MAG: hypothetical protein CM1200mP4_5500 [Rhodospirillaceae bacterium]